MKRLSLALAAAGLLAAGASHADEFPIRPAVPKAAPSKVERQHFKSSWSRRHRLYPRLAWPGSIPGLLCGYPYRNACAYYASRYCCDIDEWEVYGY